MIIRAPILLSALMLVQSVSAAEPPVARLASSDGVLVLDASGRYVPAGRNAPLRPGERLLVLKGAARLVYRDGCTVSVEAGSMIVVGTAAVCRTLNAANLAAAFQGGSGSVGQPSTELPPATVTEVAPPAPTLPPPPVTGQGLSLQSLAIGAGAGALAGAAAGAALGRSGGSGTSNPASP